MYVQLNFKFRNAFPAAICNEPLDSKANLHNLFTIGILSLIDLSINSESKEDHNWSSKINTSELAIATRLCKFKTILMKTKATYASLFLNYSARIYCVLSMM